MPCKFNNQTYSIHALNLLQGRTTHPNAILITSINVLNIALYQSTKIANFLNTILLQPYKQFKT